ncbi:sensor histidine kinase [Massilia horti]|uniref:histidine kinase n=1 Tax=Massilia horti TaxID=2562153 RepID=A0A4Y9SZT5_9BURK|nr:ATP-binding protein [Massilia horti]TFW32227.1 HAMP domain-containing protein [Massilia horti]
MPLSRGSLRDSIAVRIAIAYGLLMALSIAAISTVFYFGTVGVFERSIDAKISSIAERLAGRYRAGGEHALLREIEAELSDRSDSDTEIFLLLSPQGRRVVGNLPAWPGALPPPDRLVFAELERDGVRVSGRLVTRLLDDGSRIVVGRDLRELDGIRAVIERALAVSSVVSVLLACAGALLFRRQVESRIGKIRRTVGHVEAGDLSRRVAVQGDDEFARLSADINRMLDRIEDLMEGVRHVSNSIAHDLRTPLGRVRVRLDNALQAATGPGELAAGAREAIEDIDGVIAVFDKLLQIAAAESGVRAASFETLDLHTIATDMVELYEAVAEEQGVTLAVSANGPLPARGDRDLLGSALASLIDNAIKYGGPGARVEVSVRRMADVMALAVRDNGPGVPPSELDRLCERFYRVDRSRHLPGNGLGLSIVTAIAQLHGGRLALANANPGLEASLLLPLVPVSRESGPASQAD